ncbi:MAG TPA: hypothetical protein VLV78_10555 [Thermoanaerobaculia bacterium]|nr:hypothetical protein [Thermoanaerobaculia bacterium]
MTVQLEVPDNVRKVVDDVVAGARAAFGDALRSVVLYGSAAEGRLRASSDLNLLFVLSKFDAEQANPFRELFRFAQSAINLTSMFLLQDELSAAEDAFAQKFADIRRRHVVLFGENPFPEKAIARDAIIRRLRQILLNLSIRSREMYVSRSLREEQCAVTAAEIAGPLRSAASTILELERGEIVPPKEALSKVVQELGRPELIELLPHLSEARERRSLPAGRAAAILFQTLQLVRTLYQKSLTIR